MLVSYWRSENHLKCRNNSWKVVVMHNIIITKGKIKLRMYRDFDGNVSYGISSTCICYFPYPRLGPLNIQFNACRKTNQNLGYRAESCCFYVAFMCAMLKVASWTQLHCVTGLKKLLINNSFTWIGHVTYLFWKFLVLLPQTDMLQLKQSTCFWNSLGLGESFIYTGIPHAP
jgi:hypothetical protein